MEECLQPAEVSTVFLRHPISVFSKKKLLFEGDYSQLGQGNKDNYASFAEVTGFDGEKVGGIGVGSNHSLAVTASGKVYAWGFGDGLQLGNGEEEDEDKPVHLTGKMIEDKKVILATGGASHTLLIAA